MVKTIILIPAYKPETKMLELLEELRSKSRLLSEGERAGNSDIQIDGIVVVDDGGQEAYRDLFAKAEDETRILEEAVGSHAREDKGRARQVRCRAGGGEKGSFRRRVQPLSSHRGGGQSRRH